MTVMGVANIVLEAGTVAAALWLLVTYSAGNAWWRSAIGRAVIGLAAVAVIVLGLGVVRRLVGLPIWTQTVELALVFLVVLQLATAFHVARRRMLRDRKARS